jgi:four helix bundle protein
LKHKTVSGVKWEERMMFLRELTSPKYEALNPKQFQNPEIQSPKRYDLEERTLKFAGRVRDFVKKLPKTMAALEDSRQLIRSSGSVGANYIEANESLSKKDFVMRIKICRKEAKESKYWLCLLKPLDEGSEVDIERQMLIGESNELTSIFGAILRKSE